MRSEKLGALFCALFVKYRFLIYKMINLWYFIFITALKGATCMKKNSDMRNEKLLERAKEIALKNQAQTTSAFKIRPSGFYTADHILFYLSSGINIIIYLLYFFGTLMWLEDGTDKSIEKVTPLRNISATASILLAIAIIMVVFKFKKDKCYIFALVSVLIAVIPMTTHLLLGKTMVDLVFGSPFKYFLKFFAPSLVTISSLLHILFVIRREKKAINKKYDDILNSIYEQNKGDEERIMSNDEWENAINSYIENPYGKEKLKKSLRRKSN